MKSAGLAVILVAAASTAAPAGTYLGLGIGSSASFGGDQMQTPFQADGRSERFILGQSFGHISIEGAGTRYGMAREGAGYDGTSLAVAAKLNLPLGNGFDVFGRGGLQRTWLSTDTANMMEFDGNGWLLGGGFEYHLGVSVLGGGSVFVDYQRAQSTFSGAAGRPFDNTASMWTLGLTLTI